jgi:DNA (cytosine-5)-methyltransferase 1
MNKQAWNLTDLQSIPLNGAKVFTTFCCGGGSSMGYKRAGFEVVAACDIDQEMQRHYVANLHPKKFFLMPVKDLLNQDLSQYVGIDILDGSPPCSTFSTAGLREEAWGKQKHFREGQASQVLDDLFFDFLNVAEKIKPKVIIAENVSGMIKGNAKGYCKMIFDRLRQIGYDPQLFLINSADCGVPQYRERVFFCAKQSTIKKPKLILSPKYKHVSCEEATSDLVITDKEWQENRHTSETDLIWWPKTRQGENYGEATLRAGVTQKCWSCKRLNSKTPSATLTATHSNIKHWSEPRQCTLREWKRLGSFPDDYRCESENIGKYMIGMSVPPKMTEYVAHEVFMQWIA